MADKKKLAIKYFPASELVTFPGNPRKVKDPEAVKKLTKLIEAHGFQNPLQVWQHEGVNYILCGNHRFKAACDMGYTEFPCIVYTGTKEEALARVISDNKSSDWTEFDYPLLKDMITEIDLGHLDIEITGFGEEELEALFGYEGLMEEEQAEKDAMEDDVPDVPAEPVTRPGDLYLLGRHRLLCGDSTNITDVERLMDGKKADMVFTDPPYGINIDTFDKEINPADIIGILPVVLKENSFFVFTHQFPKALAWINEAFKFLKFKDHIVWVKRMVTAPACDLTRGHESLFIFHNVSAKYFTTKGKYTDVKLPGLLFDVVSIESIDRVIKDLQLAVKKGKKQLMSRSNSGHKAYSYMPAGHLADRSPEFCNFTNVWSFLPTNQAERNQDSPHATQKPISLIIRALELCSPDQSIILDLFLGSGSTLIACEKTGRTCYGMELDSHYCDVIVARWEKFTGKKAGLCQPY